MRQHRRRTARADEVYTFGYVGNSVWNAALITISRTGDTITLSTERRRAFPPMRSSRNLSREEWTESQAIVERSCFWTMPEDAPQLGLDGTTWSISGRRCDQHHECSRWSPYEGPFYELGCLFVRFAGVELENDPP